MALLDALHVGVYYFAVFLAVAVLDFVNPSATVEFQVEVQNENGRSHVDEREAHVELGFDIDGQVKEVIFATKLLIYDVEHIILTKFHGNILYHQSRLSQYFRIVGLITVQNSIEINPIFLYRIEHFLLVLALFLGNCSVCFVFFNLHRWKSRSGSCGLVLVLLEGK